MPSVTKTGTAGTQKHWFTDFGKWINYTGGRANFIAWIAKLLTIGLGPNWTTHPTEDLVESLFNHDQHGEQFSEVIQTETDLNELVTLINSAMSQTKPHDKRKRKPNHKRQEFELSHLSRCQRRNYLKRDHRRRVHFAKQKRKRKLACARAHKLRTNKKGAIRIGSWNTRGMGARYGTDYSGKINAIASVIADRKWNAALLTDLKFKEDGFSELPVGGATWLLIHEGKVGIALDPHLAHRWRKGGSLIYRARGTDIKDRMIGISIPNKGWKPGLLLVSIYAPLTNRSSLALRDNFREQLSLLLDKASGRVTPILAGDFNGEVGPTKDKLWTQVLGPFGDSRRTKGGEELLNFCEQEGLVVANTFSSQKHKATWYHNRWGTAHALDHFLVRARDKRWAKKVNTVHFSSTCAGPNTPSIGRPPPYSSASWLAYTDHNPIEMDWTIGKDWTKDTPPGTKLAARPDVFRLLGSSEEAKKLRIEYADLVTKALHDLEGVSLDWDAVAATMKSCAFKILGPTPPRNPLPWLQGKESELQALRNAVHQAEEKLRKARANKQSDCQQLLTERRQTSKTLLSQKKIWEAKWWDDLADKAQTAGDNNDEFTFWQVCKTLGFRETRKFHQVVKRTVADPEEDREAWKDFLSSIQKEAGEVSSSVWDLIPVVPQPHTDLANPPTWKEYQI